MSEIISIHLGQCGTQVGGSFWELISQEHHINYDGTLVSKFDPLLERSSVYFSETSKELYVPRAIFADLDPGPIDNMKSGSLGKFFSPDSFVSGKCPTGGNWGKCYYNSGAALLDVILDQVRKRIEESDSPQGLHLTQSLGGGSGSGLLSLLVETISQEFPNLLSTTFTVYTSSEPPNTSMESYNAVFTVSKIVEHVNLDFVFDNYGLRRICNNSLKKINPTFSELNELLSWVMSDVTCSLRYPAQINATLKKMATNLVPFPRIHFMTSGISPLSSNTITVPQMIKEAYEPASIPCSVNTLQGRYLTACCLFRGKASTVELEQEISDLIKKQSSYFVEWIPNNVKIGICEQPIKGHKANVAFIGNSFAISTIFKRIAEEFATIFRRKLYLYKYLEEGMDEMEFTEAESNINDLVSEYYPCNGCCSAEYDA